METDNYKNLSGPMDDKPFIYKMLKCVDELDN